MRRFAALLACCLCALPALGQTIPIKTVPVAEGNQFLLHPAHSLGFGGLSLALDDPAGDVHRNPARGALAPRMSFHSAPVLYGFTGPDNGSGRTLPIGFVAGGGKLFGGSLVAFQELVAAAPGAWWNGARLSQTHTNLYASGFAGMQIPGTRLAVAASVFRADLAGVEGVRMLYAGGERVGQDGGMWTFTGGLLAPLGPDGMLDATLTHHRFRMTHTFEPSVLLDWMLPGQVRESITTRAPEHDETNGWAASLRYRRALPDGWAVGTYAASDWKWHPKIPNYDLMRIPRDPGRSGAYRFGVGAARSLGATTYGLDLIAEPIVSHTWANAPAAVARPEGDVLPAGAKTVDNQFAFRNAHVKLGLLHTGSRLEAGGGLHAHSIGYDLQQHDFVLGRERNLSSRWTEWTLSGRLGILQEGFQVRYTGLLTLGTGIPSLGGGGFRFEDAVGAGRADFLVAPASEVWLQKMTVFTHQVSVVVPLVY